MKTRAALESAKSWKTWIHESLEKGASKAHKFAKGPGPVAPTEVIVDGKLLSTPGQILEARAYFWAGIWQKDQAHETELLNDMVAIRAAAREQLQSWDRITVSKLDKALACIPLKTGLGLDQCQPGFLRALPLEAKEEL
eukprot:14351712-Heterocapsa_arctica.AAC.1